MVYLVLDILLTLALRRLTLFGRASNRAPLSARAVAVIRPAATIIAQLAFLYILSGQERPVARFTVPIDRIVTC
jgi:hypothetical protein